jgi:predicted RNase H-like nuclease (RuvC/YqgF family)
MGEGTHGRGTGSQQEIQKEKSQGQEEAKGQEKMIRDLEQDILLIEEQVQEIKRLRAQIGNLEVQIADYQQIVRELSDNLELLKKDV